MLGAGSGLRRQLGQAVAQHGEAVGGRPQPSPA